MPSIKEYLNILHPEIPAFIEPYLICPSLVRLKEISLFCGMDYSCFFHPTCFYSRYDHSLGVALITYHFSHDPKATLAALFHDISTPVFSHVIDFKNKDYLKQTSTEIDNAQMIQADAQLVHQLAKDGFAIGDILYADKYPIADQKTPHICADRLEYMFSTGLFLTGSWTIDTIRDCYQDLSLQYNQINEELGFHHFDIAKHFFDACLVNSKLYLAPYNKISMELLAQIINLALNHNIIYPHDLYQLSEKEIMILLHQQDHPEIKKQLWLLENQKNLMISEKPLPNSFHACLNVKKRYIDPLVNGERLSHIDKDVHRAIDELFIEDHNYISLPYPK